MHAKQRRETKTQQTSWDVFSVLELLTAINPIPIINANHLLFSVLSVTRDRETVERATQCKFVPRNADALVRGLFRALATLIEPVAVRLA